MLEKDLKVSANVMKALEQVRKCENVEKSGATLKAMNSAFSGWLQSLMPCVKQNGAIKAEAEALFEFPAALVKDVHFVKQSVYAKGTLQKHIENMKKIAENLTSMKALLQDLRASKDNETDAPSEKRTLHSLSKSITAFEKVVRDPPKFEEANYVDTAKELLQYGKDCIDGNISSSFGYRKLLTKWIIDMLQKELKSLEEQSEALYQVAYGQPEGSRSPLLLWKRNLAEKAQKPSVFKAWTATLSNVQGGEIDKLAKPLWDVTRDSGQCDDHCLGHP